MENQRAKNQPLPFANLYCPRCGSMKTKFCYYNNYSRDQPRHRCNTCKRFWTVGGKLRDIPVGGTSKAKRAMASSSTAISQTVHIPLQLQRVQTQGNNDFVGTSNNIATDMERAGRETMWRSINGSTLPMISHK